MKNTARDAFREGVFARDNHKCVVCESAAQDAHHILERRLFHDGGYHLDNGASLCGMHHIEAEMTTLSTEDIRILAGIKKVYLPDHFYRDQYYDKWGNIILANGNRLKGELFFDESVQKILAQGGVLHLFSPYVKYPRTYHLPWSGSKTDDDRTLTSFSAFEGQEVVVLEKMDGENTTMYTNYIHARSIDGNSHPTRARVKAIHGNIGYLIPDGWRVCGENLYAKHSIPYDNLASYFLAFSIWNEYNVCLSWDETIEWAALLGLETVPVLYRGLWDEAQMLALTASLDPEKCEGYVVRLASEFTYADFRKSVAKYVRPNHVHVQGHWMRQVPVPNKLAS